MCASGEAGHTLHQNFVKVLTARLLDVPSWLILGHLPVVSFAQLDLSYSESPGWHCQDVRPSSTPAQICADKSGLCSVMMVAEGSWMTDRLTMSWFVLFESCF
jgi:hypothetical protein